MIPDDITLYDFQTVLRWYNAWCAYLRTQDLGGAIAAAAERPTAPFSADECQREILRRYELGLEEA